MEVDETILPKQMSDSEIAEAKKLFKIFLVSSYLIIIFLV